MTSEHRHPHADLMIESAEDTSKHIWGCPPNVTEWVDLGIGQHCVSWHFEWRYHIGPTPPPRMCTLGGLQFPEPLLEAPVVGSKVYRSTVHGAFCFTWDGLDSEKSFLAAGLVHLTRQTAELQSEAMAAMVLQAVRESI